MRNYIVPAAKRAGIQKQVSLHVFLHTFSTPLAAQWRRHQEVQSLLRHANPRNHSRLLHLCREQARSGRRRRASWRRCCLRGEGADEVGGSERYGLMCTFLCSTLFCEKEVTD